VKPSCFVSEKPPTARSILIRNPISNYLKSNQKQSTSIRIFSTTRNWSTHQQQQQQQHSIQLKKQWGLLGLAG
jgi:hypothetical protein